jgi:tetratricopeptide (TPR) repeat protein
MFGWLNRKTAVNRKEGMRQVRELMAAGNWNEAVLNLDELVVQHPKDTEIALHRGFGLRQLNRFEEALPELQRIQKTFDEDSGLWELLGDTLLNLKRYQEAVKPLTKSLDLSPDRLPARYLRGQCFQLLARNREALADCVKYITGAPNDKNGYLLKALIHEGLGEPEEGLAAARKGLYLDSANADLLAVRARLLCQAGRPEAALEAIDAATAAGRGSSDLEYRRLDLLLLLDRFSEALPILDEYISQNPNRAWHLRRAKAYAGLRDAVQADADRQIAVLLTQKVLRDIQASGIPRTVALIQVSPQIFVLGADDGCALVLLTFDDGLNADANRMHRIAKVLSEQKNKPLSNNLILRVPSNAVSNDSPFSYRRQAIPLELTEGIPCYAADLNIYREYLPDGRLTQENRVLAVIAEPGDSGRMEMT